MRAKLDEKLNKTKTWPKRRRKGMPDTLGAQANEGRGGERSDGGEDAWYVTNGQEERREGTRARGSGTKGREGTRARNTNDRERTREGTRERRRDDVPTGLWAARAHTPIPPSHRRPSPFITSVEARRALNDARCTTSNYSSCRAWDAGCCGRRW